MKRIFTPTLLIILVMSCFSGSLHAQWYCKPKSDCTWYDITSVTLNGKKHTSKCAPKNGYDSSTIGPSKAPFDTLVPGKNYTIKMTNDFAIGWGVYVDWNNDRDFLDAGEQIDTSKSSNTSYSTTIKVPMTAINGLHRLRVRALLTPWEAFTKNGACKIPKWYTYGEIEDYVFWVKANTSNDAGVAQILSPSPGCGNPAAMLSLIVVNYGNNSITKVPLVFKITPKSGTTSTFLDTIRTTMKPGEIDTFTFKPTYNTFGGSQYSMIAYTALSGDTFNYNDTVKTVAGILAGVDDPKLAGTGVCGAGSVKLYDTNSIGYSLFWYSSPTSVSKIAVGDTFKTPFLTSPTTYYAAFTTAYTYSSGAANKSIGAGGNGTDFTLGLKFDVLKPITLDSVTVYANSTGKVIVCLNDASGTLVQSVTYTVSGAGMVKIPVGMYIPIGNGYTLTPKGSTVSGLYRNTANGGYSYSASGVFTISGNNDPTFGHGSYYYYFYNWVITGPGCYSNRIAIKVNVGKPGALLTPGKPFMGNFALGSSSNPDTVSVGDTIRYNIVPPTNQTNAGYGKKWFIQNLNFLTSGGVASKDSAFIYPSAKHGGSFTFFPSASSVDSILILSYLAKDSGGCDTIITRYIYVSSRPVADYTYIGSCSGAPAQFNNLSTVSRGNLNYNWDFGDGTTSKAMNPGHIFKSGGTYNVTLKVTSSSGASDSISKSIKQNEHPKAKFIASSACMGQNTTFTDASTIGTGSITQYSYDYGDFSGIDTIPNPNHIYPYAGKYNAILIATSDKGCTDTFTNTVGVYGNPVPGFSTDTFCEGNTTHFRNLTTDSSGSPVNFLWSFGDGVTTSVDTPDYAYSKGGIYNAKLVATSIYGCSDSITQTVNVYSMPTLNLDVKNPCIEQNTQFLDTGKLANGYISTYYWDFGDTTYSPAQKPVHRYPAAGKYTLTLKETTNFGCSDSLTQVINIGSIPKANFIYIPSGRTYTFVPEDSNYTTYNWDFGDGNTSTQKSPVHTYNTDSTYTTTLSVTNGSGVCNTNMSSLKFTISTGIETDAETAINLHIFPNPFKESFDINYTLNKSGMVNISLYDITGRLISTLNSSNQITGTHTVHFNASEYTLHSGMYILRMNIGDRVIVKQVVLGR